MVLVYLTAAVAILYAVVSIVPQWNETKHKWALFWSALLGIALAFLGIFAGIESQKSSQSATDTLNINLQESRRIRNRQSQDSIETVMLRVKLDSQSTLIDKLRNENTDLSSKLTQSSMKIYNELTGGDSYCQLFLFYGNLPPGEKRHMQYIGFGVIGEYPLKNVFVRVVNLNSPDPMHREEFELKFDRIQNRIYYPTSKMIEMDTVNGVNLNIFYEANNGVSTQIFRMRYRNGSWIKAERFHHGPFANGKYLDIIDRNYPFKDPLDIFVYDKK